MRIPFIPKVAGADELGVEPARFRYITDSRGGSAFLLAGAIFWLGGAAVCWWWPSVRVEWILYGGLAVPFLGVLVAALQKAQLFGNPMYAALAAMATLTELAALPIMFFLKELHPEALPGVLLITDGAHLFVLMWLHLDYYYFLAGCLKVAGGIAFLSGSLWPDQYPPQLLVAGLISLVTALLVRRDSSRTLQLYLKGPGK